MKAFFWRWGPGGQRNPLGKEREELRVVSTGFVRYPGQIDRDVLHRGITHLPRMNRIVQVALLQP